jgi:hypothetical protein
MNVFTIKIMRKDLGGNLAQQSNHVFSSWSPLWVTLRIAQSSKKEEVHWHTPKDKARITIIIGDFHCAG